MGEGGGRLRYLGGVIALVLLVDVIAVLAHGGGSGGGAAATRTTAQAPPSITTTRPAPSTTTVVAAAASDPGQVQPPAVGTYRYVVQGANPGGLTRTVTRVTPTPPGTVTEEIKGSDGTDETVRYNRTSEVELEYTIDNSSQVFQCSGRAPEILLELPLSVGRKWSSPFGCTDFVDQRQLVELDTVTVVRRTTTTVGGVAVPTWELRAVSNQSSTNTQGKDLVTEEVDRVEQLSAATGLVLREEVGYLPQMGSSGPLTNPTGAVVTLVSMQPG